MFRVVGDGRTARSPAGSVAARKHRPDYQIVLYMGLLMMLGLIIMYAIGPQRANVLNVAYDTSYYTSGYFFLKQCASIFLALGAFACTALVPYRYIQMHAGRLLLAGIAACLVLFIFGDVLHVTQIAQCSLGACRWFELGPLGSLQPAELLKFGLLVYIAGFVGVRMKQGRVSDLHGTIIPLSIITAIAMVFIVIIQKDMGTGISLIAILSSVLMVAGLNVRMGLLMIAVGLMAGALMIMVAPHRMERVATFFAGDSANLNDDSNYHIVHAKIAIGSGGLWGVGIGNSVQATGYLPEAINDSVFAIMGETFGFVGLTVIVFLFGALLVRLLVVAEHLPHYWMKLIVAGVFGWLGSHVILNIAAMTGVFPLTGITLPLLSFGGTSMVFIAAALGLAFQLSKYTVHASLLNKEQDNENSSSRRRLGWTRNAGHRSTQ